MSKTPEIIRKELYAPFNASDIGWRLQWTEDNTKETTKGIAVPYVTNRAIQNRLDDTVGPAGWKNDFIPWHQADKGGREGKESQLCGISIYFENRSEWVTKWDGAEDSDIEPIKGGLSDSMKRAAVQWGIGRFLYDMETIFVDAEKKGRSYVIAKKERPKLDKAYNDFVVQLTQGNKKELPPVMPLKPVKAQTNAQQTDAAAEKDPFSDSLQYTHTVSETVQAPAMKGGKNTHLKMVTPDGEEIEAYLQGVDPNIVRGAKLNNVKLTRKTQNGIRYYILDAYDVCKNARIA